MFFSYNNFDWGLKPIDFISVSFWVNLTGFFKKNLVPVIK